jgi:hypothetical protein
LKGAGKGSAPAIRATLDGLAFDEQSAHQDLASQALEEWWAPGAIYRR